MAARSSGITDTLSRRRFLGVASSLIGGSGLRSLAGLAGEDDLSLPPGRPKSRVVHVASRDVVDGPTVHRHLMREMIDRALAVLTTTASAAAAWRAILQPEDVIGLKFNRSGQRMIGTTSVFSEALIRSIMEAGWLPEHIVCIEAPGDVALRLGTTRAWLGYASRPTDFASGSDRFADVLRQVSVLIDVPYLKTHNLAGVTCCLKNLSHGLIKHPARYHRNRCSPFIADIVAAAPIREKLRLCLVDALRVVYDGGPEVRSESLSDEGIVLASFDPVAADVVGTAILNDVRERHGLARLDRAGRDIAYLAAAHRRGLGTALWSGIDWIRIRP